MAADLLAGMPGGDLADLNELLTHSSVSAYSWGGDQLQNWLMLRLSNFQAIKEPR